MSNECWTCGHSAIDHFALGCLVAGCKCFTHQDHPCICEHKIGEGHVATIERVVPGCKVHCAAVLANT